MRRSRRLSKKELKSMDDLFEPALSSKIKKTLTIREVQLKVAHFFTLDNKSRGFVFATGLGKTVFDVLVIDILLNRGMKKILIIAPGVELCNQINEDLNYFREFEMDEIAVLAAKLPKKRQVAYESAAVKIYISTPECIQKDLDNNIIPDDMFELIIIDEAHQAVGNHAYTFVAEQTSHYKNGNRRGAQIVAQTATPWGNPAKREQVKNALHIENWFTVPLDEQLAWMQPIERFDKPIQLDENWMKIWNLMKDGANAYYSELFEVINNYDPDQELLKEKFIWLPQKNIKKIGSRLDLLYQKNSVEGGRAKHAFGCLQKWKLVMHYLFTENYQLALDYFNQLPGDKTKAGQRVYKDNLDLINWIISYTSTHQHPKVEKLLKLLAEHANEQKMIFINFTKSINIIQKILLDHGFDSKYLIGRNHNGMQKAKDAKQVRMDFKEGKFNLLLASQIGQQGLHFPNLETIITYSVPQTEIAINQTEGRAGRTQPGKIFYLLFSEFDSMMYHAIFHRINSMYDDLPQVPLVLASRRKKLKSLNLPKQKNKFWAKDLVTGDVVRERFAVKDVQIITANKRIKVLFNLFDKTAYLQAELWLNRLKESHLVEMYKNMKNHVVCVSGKVEVDTTLQIINILVNRIQKQDVFLIKEKDFLPENYVNNPS